GLEQPVVDRGAGTCQRIQQRRLAHVRVARQGDRGSRGAGPSLPARLTLTTEAAQAPLEDRDPLPREPPVCLQLRLARAARADSATEPLEVLPQPAHAGQVVFELSELDLELALGGDGVLGEDVQDQLRPVDDASLKRILETTLLRGLELVVDEQHV